jgi:hypothetical protein
MAMATFLEIIQRSHLSGPHSWAISYSSNTVEPDPHEGDISSSGTSGSIAERKEERYAIFNYRQHFTA